MGVTADNCHAGQRCPLLGPHDVDNTLPLIVEGDFRDAKIRAVIIQRLELDSGHRIQHASQTLRALRGESGDIVIGHRHIGADPPGLATGHAQPLKGLRRSDFMQKLAVDVDQCSAVLSLLDKVAAPQLVVQGMTHYWFSTKSLERPPEHR